MVPLIHFILVKRHSIAMIFWEIMTFKKIKERVSEAPLVVELNVDFCF